MKRFIHLFMLLLLSAVLVACGAAPVEEEQEAEDDTTESDASSTEQPDINLDNDIFIEIGPDAPIRVAVVGSNSGDALAEIGRNQRRFAELAVEDFGPLFGREVELMQGDGECSADGGRQAATEVVNDESIVAVVGHSCSDSCRAAAPIYTEAGYSMVSSSCTSPALTNPGTHQQAFLRTVFNDLGQGAVAAQYAFDEGFTQVALIDDGSDYATALVDVFRTNFEALGGTVVADEQIDVGQTDAETLLTRIAEAEPDMIYMPIFPDEGAVIATQTEKVEGLEDIQLMGADGLSLEGYVEQAGPAAEGTLITGPSTPNSDEYATLESRYETNYDGEPTDPYGAHAYDATTLILAAIREVGIQQEDGTLFVGRNALNQALYDTVNFDGVIGSITCDEFGDCGFAVAIAVSVIQNGDYVEIRE